MEKNAYLCSDSLTDEIAMKNIDYEQFLSNVGIRVTAMRLLTLREVYAMDAVFSQSDLSARMGNVDESTLFRTLSLFAEHHLLHTVDDGTGTTKYVNSSCSPACRL